MARKKKETEEVIRENIEPATLDDLMGERFGIYAEDVIEDRAIPDARDGLKPVQRRIIYAMWKTGNTFEKPTKKCAHIVGEVMGKYHPHGDSSIYEALVRMSQSWNVRLPLIDFQGNNGSMDGDGPAAYRYTEARLAAVAQELVRDIDKDTVPMTLTFDDTEWEPVVLPARFPNLLVNGAKGIAVGIATEIPTHNLREVTGAVCYRIKHPNCPVEKLMEFVPGPDFPTGGLIYQSQGLQDIYKTGRGRIEIQSRYQIVKNEEGVTQIIITEIPYQVVKSKLVGAIDQIRHDKTIAGIDEVRDETDKSGLRIAIDLKEGAKAESIVAYLMAKTDLRTSYSANMVAIVDGRPRTISLDLYCDCYIAHQKSVIARRSRFELKRDEGRLTIVNGLLKASSIIDQVVHLIRTSADKKDAKQRLVSELSFLPEQADAILDMPLYKLSHTDVATLEAEKAALEADIAKLNAILADPEKLNDVIIEDLKRIAKLYGDDRRSEIVEDTGTLREVNKRDLIQKEDVMVTVTRDGYVKRSSIPSYKGSGGDKGAKPGLKAGDTLVYSGLCQTTDFLLMFTNKGQYLYCPVDLLKATKWLEEGQHVNYAVSLGPDEKIVKAFAVRHFRDDLYFAILSRGGQIKRVRLSDFKVVRFNRPFRAMRLLESDELADVALTHGNDDLVVFSIDGQMVRYNENDVTISSTNSSGVRAAHFGGADCAALLSFSAKENGKTLLLTDLGNTRVLDAGKIVLSVRPGRKGNWAFRSFKSEPHHLVMAAKAGDREPPIVYRTTLENGDYYDVKWEDLYLTPIDKYAKKTDDSIKKNNKIAFVHYEGSDLIDDSIPSELPPEKPAAASPDAPSEEEPHSEEQEPAEKFTQISLFDDDFGNDDH